MNMFEQARANVAARAKVKAEQELDRKEKLEALTVSDVEFYTPSPAEQLSAAVEPDASDEEIEQASQEAAAKFFGNNEPINDVEPLKDEVKTLGDFTNKREREMQARLLTQKLAQMPETEVIDTLDIPAKPVSKRDSITLNDQQLLAITTAIREPFSNLIGYAGTGKTTTVLELVRQLIEAGNIREIGQGHGLASQLEHINGAGSRTFNFIMCAFTGLAVKTLRRVVPNEYKGNCATIHKLIDFGPVKREVEVQLDNGQWVSKSKMFFEPRIHGGKWINSRGFMCDENDPDCVRQDEAPNRLAIDQLIIDECSMVGVRLWKMLIDAVPNHCKIITIGDIAQLPPVLDVPIQPLLLANWPTVELTKIYRQKDGDIIGNANAIREGKKPIPSDVFQIKGIDKQEHIAQKQVLDFIRTAHANGSYDPEQDILITPMNVGMLGQEMLNVLTRGFTNPDAKIKLVSTMRGKKQYAIGDRVMNIKNDNNVGIYNGMLGWLTHINPQQGVKGSLASFAGDLEVDDSDDLFDIAATVDKMQKAQEKQRADNKVAAMFGQSVINQQEQDAEGTGEHRSSHSLEVQFDYEPEDDPDGTSHLHNLSTSSQIENLILAWWITIHKSQGSGFRNVYIVLHNGAAKMLCNELLYTAITRCIEKVTILTTNYAFNKCLGNMRIKGTTLKEKVDSYAAQFDMSRYPNLKIPQASEYKPLATTKHIEIGSE